MQSPTELTQLANLLRGLPILTCVPGSVGERAGLRYGDIVLSMNSAPTPSWFEFFQLRQRIRGSIWVRVLRRGRQLIVPLDLPADARAPRELLGDARANDARVPDASSDAASINTYS
jgi:S1-C subfamily serine protease